MQVRGRQQNNVEMIAVGHLARCAVSSAPIRTVHMNGAYEISQMIASVSLGCAAACVRRTELHAISKENFGKMLRAWLKGPEGPLLLRNRS